MSLSVIMSGNVCVKTIPFWYRNHTAAAYHVTLRISHITTVIVTLNTPNNLEHVRIFIHRAPTPGSRKHPNIISNTEFIHSFIRCCIHCCGLQMSHVSFDCLQLSYLIVTFRASPFSYIVDPCSSWSPSSPFSFQSSFYCCQQSIIMSWYRYMPNIYIKCVNIFCWSRKKCMDESGNVNTVRILPQHTTWRIRSNLISCQPIGDWQTKG